MTEKNLTKKLIESASLVMGEAPSGNDIAYYHALLCQVGLPRSKQKENSFIRHSGGAWLHVQAGFIDTGKGPKAQPLPYGPMVRLIMARISTYAVKNNTSEIPIGRSASEFLKMMGMDDQQNRYRMLRVQMNALAACRIQLGYLGRTFNGQPIEQFDAWLSDHENQHTMWPGVLKLSDPFYEKLRDTMVPVDWRSLEVLSGSALAMDIYMTLAQRLHRINGKSVFVPWSSLKDQFGQEYNETRNFKKAFKIALNQALCVYPDAKVKLIDGGLVFVASPPPVPYKGIR